MGIEIEPITPERAFHEGSELFKKRVAECVAAFNKEIVDQASKKKESEPLIVHFSGGCDMDETDRAVLIKVKDLFEYHGWEVTRTDPEFWTLQSVFSKRRYEAA